MSAPAAAKTPWHLWAVGVLGLLWNSFGVFDYFMSKTKGDEYLKSMHMTDAQIAYFNAMPAWMTVVWALGVWGALLGTILLLMRNKLAVPVFIVSLVSYVLSVVYNNIIAPMPDLDSNYRIMAAVIFIGCVFFVWYSMRAKKKGQLR